MIPLKTTDWSAFTLIINTGISISKAICSKSLKPSISGMCTSDKTISNSSFYVRKYSNAVTEDVVDVTVKVKTLMMLLLLRSKEYGENKGQYVVFMYNAKRKSSEFPKSRLPRKR